METSIDQQKKHIFDDIFSDSIDHNLFSSAPSCRESLIVTLTICDL